VLRNCWVWGCPTRRGWTICPARARPSWIIRGACPLHNLEVRIRKKREVKTKAVKTKSDQNTVIKRV
jgi:hypothetical protein